MCPVRVDGGMTWVGAGMTGPYPLTCADVGGCGSDVDAGKWRAPSAQCVRFRARIWGDDGAVPADVRGRGFRRAYGGMTG